MKPKLFIFIISTFMLIVLVLIYRRRTYRPGPARVWRGGGGEAFRAELEEEYE